MNTRTAALTVLLPLLSVAMACVSNARLVLGPAAAACSTAGEAVTWWRLPEGDERVRSDRWCAAVGPPAMLRAAATGPSDGRFVAVSWNVHVGGGDVTALVNDLRSGALTGQPERSFVLLLQEVFRAGTVVPRIVPRGARVARAIRPGGSHRVDITATARMLDLSLFYVPSMRNGRPDDSDEDRGNAILSTLPLDDCTAIELPLERQRRVAVAASVRRGSADGAWSLRLVSTHFTNTVGHHLWLLSEPARTRQARALAAVLDDRPMVLGGDLNTWFGYQDAAYKELARRFDARPPDDRRATFSVMRLDHVLPRLPGGWRVTIRRGPGKYGSDHYPVVAEIAPASSGAPRASHPPSR